jgi:hypothetical protein
MEPKFLKRGDLVSRPGRGKSPPRKGRYCFSATTLWRRVKAGTFPAPVTVAGIQCWPVDVLEAWEAAQLDGSRK